MCHCTFLNIIHGVDFTAACWKLATACISLLPSPIWQVTAATSLLACPQGRGTKYPDYSRHIVHDSIYFTMHLNNYCAKVSYLLRCLYNISESGLRVSLDLLVLILGLAGFEVGRQNTNVLQRFVNMFRIIYVLMWQFI